MEKQPHKISMKFYEEQENKISIVAEEVFEYPHSPETMD